MLNRPGPRVLKMIFHPTLRFQQGLQVDATERQVIVRHGLDRGTGTQPGMGLRRIQTDLSIIREACRRYVSRARPRLARESA